MIANREFLTQGQVSESVLNLCDDEIAKMTIAAAVVLLGAFFVINPVNLTAFADVFPDEVRNVTDDGGPIHPGEFVAVKNVTLGNITITSAVNVTFSVVNEGTDIPCRDLTNTIVLNLTTNNVTTNIITPNSSSLFYTETFVGMPGVYHCNVLFIAANVTNASNTEVVGNQTVWIDAIGTLGFWKNHPNATEQHLNITIGDFEGGFEVGDNETATKIFKEHKGPLSLEKVAAQLLAAALNVWALDHNTGTDKTSCINDTIAFTNETIAAYDGPGFLKQKFSKNPKQPFIDLGDNHTLLDKFNNFGCTLPFPPP